MAHAMGSKEVEKIREAKRSVLSWFNDRALIEVVKDIRSLKKDARLVKKFNLSKLDELSRQKKWDDMNRVFKYRFGVAL